MTTTEFKENYPQYSHLKNDALWDKMTEVFLQSDNVLSADPNQEKQYLPTVTVDVLQDFQDVPKYEKCHFTIEDSSTTRWLNKDGELVRIGEVKKESTKSNTSYSGFIWNP